MPDEPRFREVFDHIVWAQEIWLGRIQPEFGEPTGDRERAADGWTQLLQDADLDRIVDFRYRNGQPGRRTVAEIALHVINHGTYHRGHLRGLAEARGIDDFPETDLHRFHMERD